tara:strand:- start:167 stop:625 length:459 start_codon:yes stop_codon:yes gene_type:complete
VSKNKKIIWFTGQPGSGKTTLSVALQNRLKKTMPEINFISVDGDDLRDILVNKDYSEKGRRKNIETAISITKFLQSKDFLVIVSLVSPYKDLREDLKNDRDTMEIYLHTDDIRGKEDFFVKNYEKPTDNFLSINTGLKTIEECVDEILTLYW